MTIIHVPLDFVFDNPFQTRRDYGDIADLARDIEARGLLQVPAGRLISLNGAALTGDALWDEVGRIRIERRFPEHLRVQLAYGHRRLRAMRVLGKRSTPVKIQDRDDGAMLDTLWSENQQRADLNPIDRAELLAAKLKQVQATGGTVATVAAKWGLARSTVANCLRLLQLPPDARQALISGAMSERQAVALLGAMDGPADEIAALVAAATAPNEKMSSDRIREVAARGGRRPAPLRRDDPTPMLRHAPVPDVALTPSRIEAAARKACQKCIALTGPPNPMVCQDCPGVVMLRVLAAEVKV